MPKASTAVPEPGDGFCPQCEASNVKTRTCRSTRLVYCSLSRCQRKAGLESRVHPPKRVKKEAGASGVSDAAAASLAAATGVAADPEAAALHAEREHPLPVVAPDPSPQASATCARELLPAARQLALSMSQRPAAGRGFPGPCLTRPRRGAAPAPAPERSGALKRSSAMHAPSGSESSALARRIAFASPPVPRGPGRRRLPPRLP